MMTTTERSKENGCDFPLFKTPMRNGMLSSATLNDLSSYSTNKHLKYVNAISMNDLQTYSESTTTPIRFNKTNKYTTPISTQRRRALGLVNHNSNHMNRVSSIHDLSTINIPKPDELIPKKISSDDDLPHTSHIYEDKFDDLIPTNERIEHMIINQTNGINFLNYYGDMENTIRCQSPVVCNRLNVSTLLDMVDILN